MAYNAVEMADWQISEAAEKNMLLGDRIDIRCRFIQD